MHFQFLLQIWALLCLEGFVLAEQPGTDFAVVFMQNALPSLKPHLEVLLTAFSHNTWANLQIPNADYSLNVSLRAGSATNITMPTELEIVHSMRSNMTLRVSSNKPISVVAISRKPYTANVVVVSPIEVWGTDYYVVTPEFGPKDSLAQVAIVNGPKRNPIRVLLKGSVDFENITYFALDYLNLTLDPWEVLQLQTNKTLTGSHIQSQEPIAAFAGRTCAGLYEPCNHVCVQIPPVFSWGSEFIVLVSASQSLSNKVYILAATEAEVKVVNGNDATNLLVTPGMAKELEFDTTQAVFITSLKKLMVFLYVGGGISPSLHGFLINVFPVENACFSYSIVSVPDFTSVVMLIADVNYKNNLKLNHVPLRQLDWEDIPGTDLVLAGLLLSGENDYNIVSSSEHQFGLLTVGMAKQYSYGVAGVCLNDSYPTADDSIGVEHTVAPLTQPTIMVPQSVVSVTESSPTGSTIQTCSLPTNSYSMNSYHQDKISCSMRYLEKEIANLSSSLQCSLLLASSIQSAVLTPFSVTVNHVLGLNTSTSNLVVKVYELHIVMPSSGGDYVLVNTVSTRIPACLNSYKVKIWFDAPYVILETDFGLVAAYSLDGNALVLVPNVYQNNLLGQCWEGTADIALRFSSKVHAEGDECHIKVKKESWDCEDKVEACSLLLDKNGPFKGCHNVFTPLFSYEDCQRYFCKDGGDYLRVCQYLGAYTSSCQRQDAIIQPWRNDTFCPFTCPRGALYEVCTRPCNLCQGTGCLNFPCMEGCQCAEGLLWDGTTCIPSEECMKMPPLPPLVAKAPLKHLNCYSRSPQRPSCHFCSVNAFNISTFGNISSEHNANGAYDVLRKCDPSAAEWMRIVLRLQPLLPAHLHIFFEKTFFTINEDLKVWINGEQTSLPSTIEPNLFLSKFGNTFSFGWPGIMDLTFNTLGQLAIEVAEHFSEELCGACGLGNSFQITNSIFSLDSWLAEELS